MITYSEYYYNYIGNNYNKLEDKYIISNNNLTKPLNKKYTYLVIITHINGNEIISINSEYYSDYLNFYDKNKNMYSNDLEMLKNFFKSKNININIRNMYRMSTTKRNILENKNIVFKEDKKKCVILNNDNIISYAKISNIDYNGANIVIFTEKEFRNNGYATKLLAFITNYCINNNLIPIFLVDESNNSSIKVAQKSNYEIMNKEIIISLDN